MSFLGDLAVVERGDQFKLTQLHLRELPLKHVPAVSVDLAALPGPLIKIERSSWIRPRSGSGDNIET
jgi:hypothetical protein